MAVVAGVVFFVLRALFALIPGLASARPIKKWSAVGALIAAFGYLLLSGSEVATQRSFIMTAIVLIGVMVDRPALTLRTCVAPSACCCSPAVVVHPSFQMSFAATLALIAAYAGCPAVRRRHLVRGGAVGRPRDRRAHSCINGCRTGDNALRSLPFPPPRALWRHRQSAGHADRVDLGDADGPFGPYRHPVRLRRPVLAADGRRHRLDDRGRAVRRASAGRGRAYGGVRGRAVAARHGRTCRAVSSEIAAALERRRAWS